MQEQNIHLSRLQKTVPERFANTMARKNVKLRPGKTQITLRLDTDVLHWFKAQGKGYQTHINALLKAYKEAPDQQQTTANTNTFNILHNNGFIGCLEDDAQLSENYKTQLNWDNKL